MNQSNQPASNTPSNANTANDGPANTTPSAHNRSETLLPAADAASDDARLEVAEEVSLDQQSDGSRKVGQVSDAAAAAALGQSIAGQDAPKR